MSAALSDPVLTANVYCEGHLDELIHRAVAPFWREYARQDMRRLGYLWFVRYARCGEHLKIRLHGPRDHRPLMERLLSEAVEAYLASLGTPEDSTRRRSRKEAPPIDAEDRATTDYPDRTLLWTQYGRSHVSLGGKPFLLDDTYASLFTLCLGRGCELVMAALRPDDHGRFPHKVRQSTLLKLLIAGIAALGFPAEKRAVYFAFHRDWLLRFTLLKSGTNLEKAKELLTHFDLQRQRLGSSLTPLTQVASNQWAGAGSQEEADREDAEWRDSLRGLLRYITPLCADPDYHLDPFAVDPVFSPIFKVFHGVANQLGLTMLDEAFAHHILHLVDAGDGDEIPASRFPEEPRTCRHD